MEMQNLLSYACITRGLGRALVFCALLQMPAIVYAESNPASVENGKKLIAEAKCETCHASKFGGDGSRIYARPDRRVTTRSNLLTQVARCNNELNLGLFPDDEAAIAAYLNAKHYKFKD